MVDYEPYWSTLYYLYFYTNSIAVIICVYQYFFLNLYINFTTHLININVTGNTHIISPAAFKRYGRSLCF